MSAPKIDPYVRFPKYVNKTDTCWLWTGSNNGRYGSFKMYYRKQVLAHRASYMMYVGKIPEGLTINHMCRVTLCVRPDHLELMTLKDNVLAGNTRAAANKAKTECDNGHEFDIGNTYWRPNGSRSCKMCTKLRMRKYRANAAA